MASLFWSLCEHYLLFWFWFLCIRQVLKSQNLKERKYFREKKTQLLRHFSDKWVRNNLLEVILSHGLDVIFVFLVKSSSVSFLPLTCRFTEQVFSIHCPWKLSGRLAQGIVGLTGVKQVVRLSTSKQLIYFLKLRGKIYLAAANHWEVNLVGSALKSEIHVTGKPIIIFILWS